MPIGVFLLCTCVGIIASTYIKHQVGNADAASTNITVTGNNQIITEDQGTPTIQRTSTVTVKDSSATSGYTLSARLSQNTLANSTVTIGSASSSTCTLASPCALTTTARDLIKTTSSTATSVSGDTTNWTVTMTIPANATIGNYLLDIEYGETSNIPPGLVEDGNMQNATTAQCDALAPGTTLNLKDTRDNKIYRVRKMADSRCWMIDNLAYSLLQNDTGTTPNTGAPTYSPAAALISGTQASVNTQAQYAQNNNIAGQGQIPNNGNPIPSYLYNWCAALGDTSGNCSASASAVAYQTVVSGITTAGTATSQPDVTGICPAPFRLPKGGPDATTGNASTTANEFAKLDIAMGGTGISRSSANTWSMFMGTAAASSNWFGVLGGDYYNNFASQGSYGRWWSSTAANMGSAYPLRLFSSNTFVGLVLYDYKSISFAVRCIL